MLKNTGTYYNEYESMQIEYSSKVDPRSIITVKEAFSSKWNGFKLRIKSSMKLYKTNKLEIDSIMQSQLTNLVKEMTEMDTSIIDREFIHKIETFKHNGIHDLFNNKNSFIFVRN
ncbi:hypothetical protein CL658_05915 [bacterium]|nr:hypothetical protein [bacterium]|tara:strand:+ start:588 stop:932 length:345 start_codon:yes stop_codon:yes gene_type:complete